MNDNILYVTGAGISALSGIPTFRGNDGFWTIGSKNFTPQQMATRQMYINNPAEFLTWYYKRFAVYKDHQPNDVHFWLKDKNLITQNIDGLDAKAGHENYISIHGRLDKICKYHEEGQDVKLLDAPWAAVNEANLKQSLLSLFKIKAEQPQMMYSLKPHILLFDEYYTDIYKIKQAHEMMYDADKIIFMGTSFSVNITQMALEIAMHENIPVEIVDPEPRKIAYKNCKYHRMSALDYIQRN